MKDYLIAFLRLHFAIENPTIEQVGVGAYRVIFDSEQLAKIVSSYLEYIKKYFISVGYDVTVRMENNYLYISEVTQADVSVKREVQKEYQEATVERDFGRKVRDQYQFYAPYSTRRWAPVQVMAKLAELTWLPQGLVQQFADQGKLGPQIIEGVTEFLELPETPKLFKEQPERLIENNRFKRFLRDKLDTYPVSGEFRIRYDPGSDSVIVDIEVNRDKFYRFFIQKDIQPLQDQFASIFRDLFDTALLDYLQPSLERGIEDPINITVYSPLSKNKAANALAEDLDIYDKSILRIIHGNRQATFVNGEFRKEAALTDDYITKFAGDLHTFLNKDELKKVDVTEMLVRVRCKDKEELEKLKGLLNIIETVRSGVADNSLIFYQPELNIKELFKGLDVTVESLATIPKRIMPRYNDNIPLEQQAVLAARHNSQKYLSDIPTFTQSEMLRLFRDRGKNVNAVNIRETSKSPMGTFHFVSMLPSKGEIAYFIVFRDFQKNISIAQWHKAPDLAHMFFIKAQATIRFIKNTLATEAYLSDARGIYVDGQIGLGIYRRKLVIVDSSKRDELGKVLEFMGNFDEHGIYPDKLWTD